MAARNWHRDRGFGCRGSSKHRNRGVGHAGGLFPGRSRVFPSASRGLFGG